MSDQCAELTQSLARWGKQFADKSCPVSSSPTWQQMNSSEQEQLEVIQEMSTPPWSPPGITHASSVPRRTSPTGYFSYGDFTSEQYDIK